MRNLARHWYERDYNQDPPVNIPLPNHQEIWDEVDTAVKEELDTAGIGYPDFMINSQREAEVPTGVIGFSHGWKFVRAWYYWVAHGPGIPPDIAEYFHKKWGTQVRVEGHCGCPSPREYCNGFAVGSYHIDTQEGLNAFNELLASIDTRKENEDE